MATIRVRDWTKARLDEISDAESHSSHDSVIKSLLKDRELAQFADSTGSPRGGDADATAVDPADKAFEDLTVLAELSSAENGVLFLWCPSCGNEIAHLGLENPITMSVFEVECQRCLARLDQHALVGIEIGYPIEQRTVEGTLQDELRRCVVDYWDRALELARVGSAPGDLDDHQLVWQFEAYRREFGWDWPADVPVVGVAAGETYRNGDTGVVYEVLEAVSDRANVLDDYRVRRFADESSFEDGDGETAVLTGSELAERIVDRSLYRYEPV